jgi:hypothetical protein
MSIAAGWLADPSGGHELRYWDGSAWSEQVSDGGVTAVDPAPPDAPPPAPPPPPAGGGGWKDKLKSAASQAAEQGKAAADKAKTAVGEQQAKRAEQIANDPSVLWHGASKNPATGATGISKEHYRITKDKIWIESGLLGVTSQQVPLYAVKDIDVRQNVLQRGKDVGDVVLHLEDPTLGVQQDGWMGGMQQHEVGVGITSGQVVLDNIEGPYAVRELLSPLISEARAIKLRERQTQHLHVHQEGGIPGVVTPAAQPVPATPPAAAPDLATKLRELAALRDDGILTDEEFAAQKAKLLES